MKTFQLRKEDVSRKWHVINAENKIVGKLAGQIADVLRGKHNPSYTPHVDSGDYVVVINSDKINISGRKAESKEYHHYSGYPGGLKTQSYQHKLEKKSEEILESAVKGMLPKNKLQRQMLTRLRIYKGESHPHTAQKLEVLN